MLTKTIITGCGKGRKIFCRIRELAIYPNVTLGDLEKIQELKAVVK